MPTGVHLNIQAVGQPVQSYFGLHRQFAITKAAGECGKHNELQLFVYVSCFCCYPCICEATT